MSHIPNPAIRCASDQQLRAEIDRLYKEFRRIDAELDKEHWRIFNGFRLNTETMDAIMAERDEIGDCLRLHINEHLLRLKMMV